MAMAATFAAIAAEIIAVVQDAVALGIRDETDLAMEIIIAVPMIPVMKSISAVTTLVVHV